MNLTRLLALAEGMPGYRRLLGDLKEKKSNAGAAVLEAARPYLIAALYRDLMRPVFVVTARPENARKLHEQLAAWGGFDQLVLFPEPDMLPYQRAVADPVSGMERLQAVSALTLPDGSRPLIIASVPALSNKLTPRRDFSAACHIVELNARVRPEDLLRRWGTAGYRLETTADLPGTMSRRGGILDVYPPSSDLPARIDFFGDTVESIRLFDPVTQRSVRAVQSIRICPSAEVVPFLSSRPEVETAIKSIDLSRCNAAAAEQMRFDLAMLLERQVPREIAFYAALFNTDSILDYLPQDTLLVIDEPQSVRQAIGVLDEEAGELRAGRIAAGDLPGNFPVPYFSLPELELQMSARPQLGLASLDIEDSKTRQLDFTAAQAFGGQLPTFLKKVRQMVSEKRRLVVVSLQSTRLSELLNEAGLFAPPITEVKHMPRPGSVTLLHGSLAEGWVLDGTHLLTDTEIFGFARQRRLVRKRPVSRYGLSLADISPGDHVVHIDHGIGRFTGTRTMTTASTRKEYLVLQYGAGDMLYVPTDQIDRVSRYVGAGDRPPVLSRLGTQDWAGTKQRAKESAQVIARDLLELHASREVNSGFAYSPDTVWQQELEASFPYVETPDQLSVQQQVKEDMEKSRPMDRLVCGDVGYGKTEIAVRAAFKAVMDGKQVAVLVPTTVLAQQHYNTFSQRLGAFPVKIEVLSRFRTHKEQQNVLKELANGTADIVIGTHRLLQKDVVFKDLGLAVIDEEQRFGVAHKEFLKKLRREVDVLTLTATPIPRTLHMALAGVRDLSTIETPPEDRLPIKTYVAGYDDRLVREAILKELERNGQVFFVHNRVQSIAMVASKLQALVPEARIAVGHGQMEEGTLEQVMTDFMHGKTDVLVCTTIIESGLDMPNANTMLVNNADKLGLTQLYQLRGRIGRGGNTAYAYFLYARNKRLTPAAEKRLKTIFAANELGAGFNIAMKDLEIRGAGTLLGTKQSGHINAVGFDLYMRLLAEAVDEQKAKLAGAAPARQPRLPEPTVDLPVQAYIPEVYVPDLTTRMGLYRRLVNLKKPEQAEEMAGELRDRFGPLPASVKNLLYAVRIRALAALAGIESISSGDGQIVVQRFEGLPFDRKKLEPLLRPGLTLGATQVRLAHRQVGTGWQQVLEEIMRKMG